MFDDSLGLSPWNLSFHSVLCWFWLSLFCKQYQRLYDLLKWIFYQWGLLLSCQSILRFIRREYRGVWILQVFIHPILCLVLGNKPILLDWPNSIMRNLCIRLRRIWWLLRESANPWSLLLKFLRQWMHQLYLWILSLLRRLYFCKSALWHLFNDQWKLSHLLSRIQYRR